MNSTQALRAARSIVEKRRLAAELACDELRARLYTMLPLLSELDAKRTELGVTAARLAADGQGQAAQKKLDAMRLLQEKKRRLLAEKGFSLADLQPRYTCRLCKDTGIFQGRYCRCIEEEIKKLRRQEIHARGALRTACFDSFSVEKYPEAMEGLAVSPRRQMLRILEDARDYAESFGLNSQSLYLYGNAGLGKTHIALAIAGVVLDKGFDVIYVSAQSAFAEIGESKYEHSGGELFATLMEADLLVMDDLGTESHDSYTLSMLYQLVNSRMNNRPTIYTTNICTEDLLNMRYTEKIASRLLGSCHPMCFLGYDIRRQGC